jgi:hypothetical protein
VRVLITTECRAITSHCSLLLQTLLPSAVLSRGEAADP